MIQDVKGFRVEYETHVDAPRAEVFDAMVDLDSWFPHRFKAGSPYVQELGLLGRGYEDWGNGEGALFSVTTFIRRPDVWVVFNMPGVFGPWMGISTMRFEDDGDGTKLSISLFGLGDVTEETGGMYSNGYPGVFQALKDHLAAKRAKA